jgi:hypothetical protein
MTEFVRKVSEFKDGNELRTCIVKLTVKYPKKVK